MGNFTFALPFRLKFVVREVPFDAVLANAVLVNAGLAFSLVKFSTYFTLKRNEIHATLSPHHFSLKFVIVQLNPRLLLFTLTTISITFPKTFDENHDGLLHPLLHYTNEFSSYNFHLKI